MRTSFDRYGKKRRPINWIRKQVYPKHWEVDPGENGLIFQVRARVFKKGALEYRITRNGEVITDWTGNKANNSFIWIDDPAPGEYLLEMRYRKQRHQVTSYPLHRKASLVPDLDIPHCYWDTVADPDRLPGSVIQTPPATEKNGRRAS